MASKKFFIILVLMIAGGLGIYYLIAFDYYPTAVVNFKFIGAKRFNEALASAYHYYTQALDTYNNTDAQEQLEASIQELRRAMLDKMVQDVLISAELENRVGPEVEEIVENKLTQLKIENENFHEAVSSLYGLTLPKFKELVLVPQAREEILEGQLALINSSYSEWLKTARTQANVLILAPDLVWNGQEVVFKSH